MSSACYRLPISKSRDCCRRGAKLMPSAAEPFSFAKARGDGVYLLTRADEFPITFRVGSLVFIPFWLVLLCPAFPAMPRKDVSRYTLVGFLSHWVGHLVFCLLHIAVIAVPVVFGLFCAIYVRRLIIDIKNRRFTETEGLWPLLSSRSGGLEDIRFVRMSSHDRQSATGHRSGNSKPGSRYMGFSACVVSHCGSFMIVHFERAVPYEGASTSDFPWEVYSERLNGIRAFFEPLGVEVRDEIGGRKEDLPRKGPSS